MTLSRAHLKYNMIHIFTWRYKKLNWLFKQTVKREQRCMASATVHAGALAAAPSAASKDPTVNALLFRWKVRTGRWSTNYLRFTWAVVLSSSTDRASAVIV